MASTWPKTADGLWYIAECQALIPVGPETGVAQILLRPKGGIGIGFTAIEQGEPGAAATIQEGPITFTELAYDDPTAGGLTVTEISPGVYAFSGQLHKGAPGDDGVTGIDLETITGTPLAGKLIRVNSALDGFDFGYERIPFRISPGSISNTSSSNPQSTLTSFSVSSNTVHFDWRPMVVGCQPVIQSGGSDVIVDLVARLNGETDGDIVAFCPGMGGSERLIFSPGPPTGSSDSLDKVTANAAATVHVRTEQRTGANSYTTSNSLASFTLWGIPA